MAPRTGTLTVRVISDTKPAEKGLERLGQKVETTGDKFERSGRKMTLFATVPIAAAMGLATNAASDLEQSVGGVESVFGDAAGEITAFGETASQTAGLSKRQVNEMAAVIGASLQGLGFEAGEAATTVVDLEKRAADMAATFGGTTEEAIQSVASALRGERDPIEKYGVSIKQADINARVLALGLDTSTTAAKKKSEAIAALDLIMGQTAQTEGQFAREADGAAGSMQIAKAEIENAAAEIGDALLPIAAKAAGAVGDLAATFGDLPEPVQNSILALAGVVAAAGPVMTVGGKLINNAKLIGKGFDKLATGAYTAAGSLGPLAAGLGVGLVALYAWQDGKNKARQRTEEFTAAIEQDSGALGENTEALILNRLEQRNQTDDLARAGVSFEEVTAAIQGNDEARAALADKLRDEGELNFGLAQTLHELATAYDASINRQETRNEIGAEGATVTDNLTDSSAVLTDQLSDEEAQAKRLNDAVKALNDATDRLIGSNLSAEQASLRAEEAHASLTGTLKENGATLDIHSEKGRANREAITSAADAALAHVEALKEQGASTDEVNFFLSTHVERLKETMRQAGLTEDEINSYITTLGLTPDNIATIVQLNGVAEAEEQLNWVARDRTTRIYAIGIGETGTGRRAFHAGGTFNADRPGGEGLALLRDGERVSTPTEPSHGSGMPDPDEWGRAAARAMAAETRRLSRAG